MSLSSSGTLMPEDGVLASAMLCDSRHSGPRHPSAAPTDMTMGTASPHGMQGFLTLQGCHCISLVMTDVV